MDAGKDKNKALSIKMSPCSKQEKEVESKSQQKSVFFSGLILLAIFLGLVLINQNSNDISLIKTYLKSTIDAIDYQGNTKLTKACKDGNIEDVKVMLKLGADANGKDIDQCTPLHLAAENGHSKIAELLLQNGAYVDAQDNFNDTPLHIAAEWGYPEVVEVLLKHGAKKDLKNQFGRTPLQVAEYYKRGDYKKVIALLKEN